VKVEFIEETSVRKALAFEIEAEVVDKEIEARVRDYTKKLRLPGFRPGKVPADVVRTRFKDQVLGDVAETLVNRVVMEEIEGRGLRPLANPKVAELKIEPAQPMTFRATFETLPIVELPEYRGLEAKARKVAVSDEDVDKEVDRMREEAARFDPVEDRPARKGDFVVVDLSWSVEGGKGGHDENALIEVGGEGNHADVNAALEGMSPTETKEITATYPADHGAETVAGKTVHYTATLKAVKNKVVPAADDEFAKDLGDWDDLAALRATIREQLTATEERRADREAKDALVAALVEKASFEVPETLIEQHMSARTESAVRGLAMQGIDPRKLGVDWKGYREGQREESVKSAKADILLDEIARRENIEVPEADLDAEVGRLAERMKKSKEALRRQMEKEGDLHALRARMREERTLDLLKANARLDLA
jgi:trigger factor